MVEGRAGRCSAAAAGQGAGGGDAGGAEQTPAVHVLHTQIRPGGAAAGEDTTNTNVSVFIFREGLSSALHQASVCSSNKGSKVEKQPDNIQYNLDLDINKGNKHVFFNIFKIWTSFYVEWMCNHNLFTIK